jgi:hypothetical protein
VGSLPAMIEKFLSMTLEDEAVVTVENEATGVWF